MSSSIEIAPIVSLRNYVTEAELAESLKLSPRQVFNLRSRKLIPFLKIGAAVRFNPEAVNIALEKLTVEARHERAA